MQTHANFWKSIYLVDGFVDLKIPTNINAPAARAETPETIAAREEGGLENIAFL